MTSLRDRRPNPRLAEQLPTHVWVPAVAKSGIDFQVRVHELRHAHASWLLAGGSDVKSVMDRMGHVQIQTTPKYRGPSGLSQGSSLDRLRSTVHRLVRVA